ncbi:MAG TPA: cytochrome c oxidase subunit I [Candidatus Limnocylindrales bacterium]|nr:cytochrome c oxidase subunit I [Candidatus Limnocylindrales bacterium]
MATTTLTPAASAYRSGLYEWLTTTDHKKIGILYLVNSFVFFFIGGLFALLVRSELAQPGLQILHDELLYNQLFTMHGTVMIFLFIIPVLVGFGNYVVPLQIGAPDMAFPRINALSFWMLPLAGILLLLGFLTGGAAQAGWTSYSPLAQDRPLASTGPGQDLWIMALLLIGTSSILGGINFLVTIFKMRAPGMTMFRMPILAWTVLVTSVLVVMATPVLASALIMLFIDRNYGGHFFDPSTGGNAILWQNVFWFYSHPAVYIMVLPAMGMISEILPVFSRKPLFGYKAFVFATAAIGALGFSVWAHHMFTTGSVYLPFFSLMTFLIAVPTGVKMFNWIFTLFRGKLTFSTPLLFAVGFLSMFLIGGINGAFSAAVPVDFALQDTYWVVAHLHYVLFGGSVFGVMAGLYYWFPKMTGRLLNESLGKLQFALMFIGFNMTFFPMHQLGLAGMPRRIADYASNAGWNDLNLLATVGGFLIASSMIPLLWNIFISLRAGEPAGDDPWGANTLEWATSSPPPPYNFDRLPEIRSERPLFDLRHGRTANH